MSSNILQLSSTILAEKNNKIIPENIKAGVQVFNITGNFGGVSTTPLRSASVSNIQLFDSISQMRNTSANDGTYGVVYNDDNFFGGLFKYNLTENVWNIADIGATADAAHVGNAWFYGINGVEYGQAYNTHISSRQDLIDKLLIAGTLPNATYSLTRNGYSNLSHLFANRTDLKVLGYLSFGNNTGITNMEGIFEGCNNIDDSCWARMLCNLPDANQITNKHISNMGIDPAKVLNNQIVNTLYRGWITNKGYILD